MAASITEISVGESANCQQFFLSFALGETVSSLFALCRLPLQLKINKEMDKKIAVLDILDLFVFDTGLNFKVDTWMYDGGILVNITSEETSVDFGMFYLMQ